MWETKLHTTQNNKSIYSIIHLVFTFVYTIWEVKVLNWVVTTTEAWQY
jgi:hypothetical protein